MRSGLDAPLSAAELKRIYRERTGQDVPELDAKPDTPAPAIARSDRDVDELVIRVPMPPTLTNSGRGRSRHWWALHAEKKRYWRTLDAWRDAKLIDLPPKHPIGNATVSSVMRLGARMDDDNAMARHKWLIDWLATRGYLVNDRLLRWSALPEQTIARTEPMITLTIRRIPAHSELTAP